MNIWDYYEKWKEYLLLKWEYYRKWMDRLCKSEKKEKTLQTNFVSGEDGL